jgi:outer membrane protein assembly factor BamB
VSPPQKVVFVGARRSLLALDRETGTPIWTYIIPLDSPPTNDVPVQASPAIAAGAVYIKHKERDLGVPYDFLYAFLEVEFDPPDGTGDRLWQRPLSNPASLSSPAVFDGLLFIGTNPYPGIDYHVWAIKDP